MTTKIEVVDYIIKVIRVRDQEWYYLKSNGMWDTDMFTKNKDEAFLFKYEAAQNRMAAIDFQGTYKANLIRITPTTRAMMQRSFNARRRIQIIMGKHDARFLTLTQDPKLYDATNVERMRMAVKNALRGITASAFYYAVFEQHKKGTWHCHIICDGETANTILERWKRGFTYNEPVRAGHINKSGKWIDITNELIKYVAKNTDQTKPMFSRTLERERQARKEVYLNNSLGHWKNWHTFFLDTTPERRHNHGRKRQAAAHPDLSEV